MFGYNSGRLLLWGSNSFRVWTFNAQRCQLCPGCPSTMGHFGCQAASCLENLLWILSKFSLYLYNPRKAKQVEILIKKTYGNLHIRPPRSHNPCGSRTPISEIISIMWKHNPYLFSHFLCIIFIYTYCIPWMSKIRCFHIFFLFSKSCVKLKLFILLLSVTCFDGFSSEERGTLTHITLDKKSLHAIWDWWVRSEFLFAKLFNYCGWCELGEFSGVIFLIFTCGMHFPFAPQANWSDVHSSGCPSSPPEKDYHKVDFPFVCLRVRV